MIEDVKTFMETFGQEVKSSPHESIELDVIKLRLKLIGEEFGELCQAVLEKDMGDRIAKAIDIVMEAISNLDSNHFDYDPVESADAITDILYVTIGAGHAFGTPMQACFDEVQGSNMSKLGEDGLPIYREDGKIQKGPNYYKPNLSKIINVEV